MAICTLYDENQNCYIQAIGIAVKTEGDDNVLKSFVELVEVAPKLVKQNLNGTLSMMLEVYIIT